MFCVVFLFIFTRNTFRLSSVSWVDRVHERAIAYAAAAAEGELDAVEINL